MTDFKPGDRVEWDAWDGPFADTRTGKIEAPCDMGVEACRIVRRHDGEPEHRYVPLLRHIDTPHTPTQEELEDVFRDVGEENFYVKDGKLKQESSPRASLLNEAKALVTGDRNNTYGAPTQDFQRTADALQAMGYRGPDGRALQAHDVAILVAMVKISRLMWTPQKRDSWADLAGYAACGYECAVTEVDA